MGEKYTYIKYIKKLGREEVKKKYKWGSSWSYALYPCGREKERRNKFVTKEYNCGINCKNIFKVITKWSTCLQNGTKHALELAQYQDKIKISRNLGTNFADAFITACLKGFYNGVWVKLAVLIYIIDELKNDKRNETYLTYLTYRL